MFRSEGFLPFLAYRKSKPVAAAGLFMFGGVATLRGGTTLPEERGRGIRRPLISKRLRAAAELQCEIVTLKTEPRGGAQRNALRERSGIAYTLVTLEKKPVND